MSDPEAGCSTLSDASGVELLRAGGICVVALSGEHDLNTVPSVQPVLDEARAQGLPLVLDLSGATFVDSSVIKLVVQLSRKARQPGSAGFAVAVRPGTHPARVLDLGGVRDLLSVHDGVDQASAALRPRA